MFKYSSGKEDLYINRNNKRGRKRSSEEAFEDDIGIVHYRSSSGLHSPPGYYPKQSRRRPTLENITLKEGSLFNMSLKFMSQHIDLLDSLVGLPEIIGEQLFSYMVQEKVLNFEIDSAGNFSLNDQNKMKMLAVFDEAYNELVLKSLSLQNISEKIDFTPLLRSFQNLVELDLSGRTLSDETLSMLSKFYCLEKLILQNNRLTDESITKFTLPYRVFKDNPQELEFLDISDNNEITNNSMEHLLLTFPKLKTLNLTGTSITMHYNLVYELKQFGWHRSHDETITLCKPKTIGWAEPIISHIQDSTKLKVPASTKASKFYSSKKKLKVSEELRIEKNNLILVRTSFPSHPLKVNKAALLGTEKTKCMVIGQQTRSGNVVAHKKENCTKKAGVGAFFLEEDEKENQDIFLQYTNCKLPSGKTSLFEGLDTT